jgi:hypothetical protein
MLYFILTAFVLLFEENMVALLAQKKKLKAVFKVNEKSCFFLFFIFMARQPYMGLGLLVSSRFHDHTF